MSIKLLVFPHSHYCEKARWALDFKKVPFTPVAILPGFHLITVRKYAPGTSVPVLIENGTSVQGSGEIIHLLEKRYPEYPLTPTNTYDRKRCFEIEDTLGETLGVSIRRILYSRLLDYPAFVRHCFTQPMGSFRQLLFRLYYPVLRYKIYEAYVISEKIVERAKRDFNRTMDKLEKELEGKNYLIGERFSRADLTVASMLSLVAMPPEHPFPWEKIPDPQIQAIFDEYKDHPVIEWTRKMYTKHRLHNRQNGA